MLTVAAHGATIPALGFGTYGMGRTDLPRVLPAALRAGFRHIDAAQIYHNQDVVGDCVEASGVAREEIFITTKVWVANYPRRAFGPSIDESLRKLRTDYIDLLLLHWPSAETPLIEQLEGLAGVVKAGKVRHVGLSNFNIALQAEAVSRAEIPLVANQFEYHPYLNQSRLIGETRRLGLSVTAYCGMAVGRVMSDPVIADVAARRGRTIAQVVLRWLVQQDGVVALSRTTNPDRVAQNLAILDFELAPEEMALISGRAVAGGRIVNPPGLAPVWDPTPATESVETDSKERLIGSDPH